MFEKNKSNIMALILMAILVSLVVFVPGKSAEIISNVPDAEIMSNEWAQEFRTLGPGQQMHEFQITENTLVDLLSQIRENGTVGLHIKTDWNNGDVTPALIGSDLRYREKIGDCPPYCDDTGHDHNL